MWPIGPKGPPGSGQFANFLYDSCTNAGPRRKQIEAVDAHAIAVKTNLLALDTEIRNVKIDSGARLKNDAVDESTQHEIAE